jgi:hypothetical protein
MRFWSSAIAAVVLALLPLRAEAVTIRDLVALSKSGVSDEILMALIDADRTVFTLDADQLILLKSSGVSDRVVLKMLRSGREFAPPDPEPLVDPPPVVVQEAPPQVVEVPVTVVQPVYVPYAYPVASVGFRHVVHNGSVLTGVPVDQFRGDFGRFMVTGPVQHTEIIRPARVTPPPLRTFAPARTFPPPLRTLPQSIR